MNDLHQRFREILQGRVCVVGVGNVELGDDGAGVRLAEVLAKSEIRNPAIERDAASFGVTVVVAGAEPERYVSRIAEDLFDNVVFLDAVEFGGAPGDVVLLNAEEMAARFPQVSTHKLSLGMLAQVIETGGPSKAWLLGVQPESLREGGSLSPKVQASIELLASLVGDLSDEWHAKTLRAAEGRNPFHSTLSTLQPALSC